MTLVYGLFTAIVCILTILFTCNAAPVHSDTGMAPRFEKTLKYSGYTWRCKDTGEGVFGPGPNHWSDTNAWVDKEGRLHLRISQEHGRWRCAEVVNTETLGYGTYKFILDSSADSIPPNVVLGLFTWSDEPAFNHREADVEVSRWGNPEEKNCQFVVQPYQNPVNIFRFNLAPGSSMHSIKWEKGRISFTSQSGSSTTARTFTKGIPVAGGENVRMNLWLFNGLPPMNQKENEVIVRTFSYTPI